MEIVRVRAVRVCVILSVDDNTVLYVYSICYVWGEGRGARPDELCPDGVGLLAVALFVESYVDHDPKQQNPQHFHTFILHGWWMVSKSFIIEMLHEQLKVWLSSLKSCRLVRVTLTCFL